MHHTGRPGRFVVVILAIAAAGAFALFRGGAPPARPDIVLVVWDTCRGDRATVNGYALPTTPRLAAFAAEGRTFRQCYTPSPWTPPAHASLFTGLLPRNHGLRETIGDRVDGGIPLLAETLRDAGYETIAVVANSFLSDARGLVRGFGRRVECFETKFPGATGTVVADRVAEILADRKAAAVGRPLFLFVNLMETHVPYAFDAAEVEAVRGVEAVEPARAAANVVSEPVLMAHTAGVRRVDPAIFPALGAAYDGAVRLVDRSTGRILDALREHGVLDRGVVVICGDHGENLGEHGALGHAHSVGDAVLHVPLVVRWPGRFEPGSVEEGQVRLQDVYPTLLEAAGVPVPRPCGRDAVTLTESPLRPRVAIATFGPATDRSQGLAILEPGAPPQAVDQPFHAYVAVREPNVRPGARKYSSWARTDFDGNTVELRERLVDPKADPAEDRNLLEGGGASERATADRLRNLGGR